MKATSRIEEAQKRHSEAVDKMEDWDAKLQALDDDATEEERSFTKECFDAACREAERWAETVERLVSIAEARGSLPVPQQNESGIKTEQLEAAKVVKEPLVYDRHAPHSFFRDLYRAKANEDPEAQKRLHLHQHQMVVEKRDVTTADPGASGIIPPVYLAAEHIDLPRPKRQFADAVPKIPLPDSGMDVTFPRVQSGATVAIQATEGGTVSETDPDWEQYKPPVRTIAGQVDLTRQALERSSPGADVVIFRDLLRAYDSALDTQLLSGSGSSGQHTGLRNISGINAVTATGGDASNTVKKIYEGASAVASNAFTQADAVLMHPRRAAAIASFLGSTFPLLNQGGLGTVQAGEQNMGFAGTIAGLRVISDANVASNLGAGTNEDEVYVLALDELMLAEGDLRTRVFEDVLSDSLKVRLQVFAYSIAPLGRVPKAIARISGTNLVTPTFA